MARPCWYGLDVALRGMRGRGLVTPAARTAMAAAATRLCFSVPPPDAAYPTPDLGVAAEWRRPGWLRHWEGCPDGTIQVTMEDGERVRFLDFAHDSAGLDLAAEDLERLFTGSSARMPLSPEG
jgi:hypothetical protein